MTKTMAILEQNSQFKEYLGQRLLEASKLGHTDLVEQLLQTWNIVNYTDSHGWTPLLWAVDKGHSETVRQIIACSANVNHASHGRTTPLHVASLKGYNKIGLNFFLLFMEKPFSLFGGVGAYFVGEFFVVLLICGKKKVWERRKMLGGRKKVWGGRKVWWGGIFPQNRLPPIFFPTNEEKVYCIHEKPFSSIGGEGAYFVGGFSVVLI